MATTGAQRPPDLPHLDQHSAGGSEGGYDLSRYRIRHDALDLLERFYHQIRYGCQNSQCRTPSCLSYKRRRSGRAPLRAPRPTSARALAVYLLDLDDPLSRLCPHAPAPKRDQTDLAVPSAQMVLSTPRPTPALDGRKPRTSLFREDFQISGPDETSKESSTGDTSERHEKLDWKSLVQVLFNTSAWKYARIAEVSGGSFHLVPRPKHAGSDISGSGSFAGYEEGPKSTEGRRLFSRELRKSKDLVAPDHESPQVHDSRDGDLQNESTRKNPYLSALALDVLAPVLPWLERCSRNRTVDQQTRQSFERTTPVDMDGICLPLDATGDATKSALFCYNLVAYLLKSSTKLRAIIRHEDGPSAVAKLLEEVSEPDFFCEAIIQRVLSSPEVLTACFLDAPEPETEWTWDEYQTVDVKKVCTCFLIFFALEDHPRYIYPSLWRNLDEAYRDQWPTETKPRQRSCCDVEAAHLVNIGLGALLAGVFIGDASVEPDAWATYTTLKTWGRFIPTERTADVHVRRQVVNYAAIFEDELAVRLARRILRAFASRTYANQRTRPVPGAAPPDDDFTLRVVRFLASDDDRSCAYGRMVLEWARTVFQRHWDGSAKVAWASDAGCALEFMRVLHAHCNTLGLDDADFALPFIFKRLDLLETPVRWLRFRPARTETHLLDHPWLFPPAALVTSFRACNYAAMFDAFATAFALQSMVVRLRMLADAAHGGLLDRLALAQRGYLVLDVRRAHILDDALDQLWRRRAKELRRPLKIRMGAREGEEGVDLGGVQQEFFRLAFAQALDPDHGLFAVDEVTRMAWFVPRASAPLYQFVLIGLLMGLAVYNNVTLPVTFPLALYRKLLDWSVKTLDHIADGWPTLANGLQSLLDWSEGDVEDVFVRSYVFSGMSDGGAFDVDMHAHSRDAAWPPGLETSAYTLLDKTSPSFDSGSNRSTSDSVALAPESAAQPNGADSFSNGLAPSPVDGAAKKAQEAPMVTNANRAAYVDDYIHWLTDKTARPQYEAFATGFYLPLERPALRLFSPEALRNLIEGIQEIDLDALERVARYENGFSAAHPRIVDFWRVVRSFSPADLKQLLEFITASDRVPVKGVEEMLFVVQRNGSGDERLPTSMTCFGRLLLPEYSSRERLEERLRLAIENSRGFGVA